MILLKPYFFLLLIISSSSLAQNLDFKILNSLNEGNMPIWDKSMKGVSFSVYAAMPITVGGIWLHGHFKNDSTLKKNAYKGAVAIGFAIVMSSGIKYLVNRPRPYVTHPTDIIKRDEAGPFSFPSGHTNASFATATTLSLTYKKWYVAVPAFTYASFVGYSRMRLGMHYPSDVLAGAILGSSCAWLTWRIERALNKKKRDKVFERSS